MGSSELLLFAGNQSRVRLILTLWTDMAIFTAPETVTWFGLRMGKSTGLRSSGFLLGGRSTVEWRLGDGGGLGLISS